MPLSRRSSRQILFGLAGSAAFAVCVVLTGCSATGVTTTNTHSSGDAALVRPSTVEGPYEVDRVIDGDTVRVFINGTSEKVRLVGIDTPETGQSGGPVECFATEATKRATELMDGSSVWLEFDPGQGRQDRYGRLLAFVWTNEHTLVNYDIVAGGFAYEYTYDEAYPYQTVFREAESTAEQQGRGLWSAQSCGGSVN